MRIAAAGEYFFPKVFRAGRKVLIDVAGTVEQFNGASVTIGYKAADGEFSPCVKSDGSAVTITSRGGFEVRVPRSGLVGISLSAAPTAGGITLDVIAGLETLG